MKKRFILLVILLGILLYFLSNSTRNNDLDTLRVIKVGMAVGLTGYAAEWGESELAAVKMVFDNFNAEQDKVKLDLIVQDTKTDGLGTTNAIKHLVEISKVDVIIGPTWGESFQGGHSISNNAKIWSISPSTSISTLGESKKLYLYLLSTWWRQDVEISTLQKYMEENGLKRIVLISDKDAYNEGFINDFAKTSKEHNFEIVLNESLPIGTTDFRTTISKAKVAKPDALLILLQDTSQVGPFNKQLKELGVTDVKGEAVSVFSTSFVESYTNLKTFPGMFDGVKYAFPKIIEDNVYKAYLEQYKKEYADKTIGSSFVPALNAAQVVVEGVLKGSEKSSFNFSEVKIKGIGVDNIEFDSTGQIEGQAFEMKKVENNEFKIVE